MMQQLVVSQNGMSLVCCATCQIARLINKFVACTDVVGHKYYTAQYIVTFLLLHTSVHEFVFDYP